MTKTKKIKTLKENFMFSKLYSKGKSFSSRTVAMYFLKNYIRDITKIGITVSKNRGNAVVRNRVKRKIRESYRSIYPFVKEGYIIVVVAKQACVNSSVADITADLHTLLKKAALLGE
ncbi:MAG: ribonuclease P protein component [Clostridia bacterium]